MGLRIYDTQTRKKRDFEPAEPGKVKMYVCGITSYAPSHIGHGRCYVAFDVIYRWLKRNYLVTYVRNFTDVDDKIIKAAGAAGEDPNALAERYIQCFDVDMAELGCARPDVEPRVTRHIPEIVSMVQTLVEKNHAYAVDGDVYFDVSTFAPYGKFSGRTLEDLEAGARVDVDTRKKSPHDFALWKSAKPGEPSWDSPWGQGRPGWHIECSAMSSKYLGATFDIHGGGKDLVFPHHENEIAQSCAANSTDSFAHYWMHNGFVNVLPAACPKCGAALDAEAAAHKCAPCGYALSEAELKMSKSLGNFYPVRDMLSRYEGEALRMFFLNSHYRKPITFSPALIDEAETRLDKTYETLATIDEFTAEQTFIPGKNFAGVFDFDPRERFAEAMDDDFNTAKALADLAELFRIANDLTHGAEKDRIGKMLSPEDTSRLLFEIKEIIVDLGGVLGLWQTDARAYIERRKMARAKDLALTPAQIEGLIQERADARKNKDFQRGDEIRDELRDKGIILRDSKDGTTTWDVDE